MGVFGLNTALEEAWQLALEDIEDGSRYGEEAVRSQSMTDILSYSSGESDF